LQIESSMNTSSPKQSFWSELEALGLHEIVMMEQVRARRAVVNAAGGPLSVRERPQEPVVQQLAKIMKSILDAAE